MKVPRVLAKYVDVVNHPGVYIKAEIDRVTKDVKVKVSEAMGKVIVFGMLAVFGLFLLTFASLTLAFFLNSVLDSEFYGFLIVTGLYLAVVIFLVVIRNNDSLQRKLFGLPKPEKPPLPKSHQLPAPDKVDPRKFGVAKPLETSLPKNGKPTVADRRPDTIYPPADRRQEPAKMKRTVVTSSTRANHEVPAPEPVAAASEVQAVKVTEAVPATPPSTRTPSAQNAV